jgi:hypothetical protein
MNKEQLTTGLIDWDATMEDCRGDSIAMSDAFIGWLAYRIALACLEYQEEDLPNFKKLVQLRIDSLQETMQMEHGHKTDWLRIRREMAEWWKKIDAGHQSTLN